MNLVVLVGRLSRDPELTFTPGSGKAVCKLSIATDKYNSKTGQKEADFNNAVLWNKQAEAAANNLTKGSQIAISGRLQTRSYEAKDGGKRYVTEVVVNDIQYLSKTEGNKQQVSIHADAFGGGSFEDEEITPVEDGDMPF